MAEVLVDGSSHAQGLGDERGMGGYAGRSQHAYERYSEEHIFRHTKAGRPEQAGRSVFFHHRSAVNKSLIEVSATLERHVDIIRETGRKGHLVGVFDVGMFSSNRLNQDGEDASLVAWEQALDKLQRVCVAKNITAIVVGSPLPLPESLWLNGTPTDPERGFLGRLAIESARHTADWAEAYISPEKVLGAAKPACMADGVHLNATGYQKLTSEIIPHINDVLGIPHEAVPLPER